MIYLIGFLGGCINGLFASGAGQVIVFYLIFILFVDTHKARATCIFCISIITIISLIGYYNMTDFKIVNVIVVAICGLVFGYLGSVFMKKVNSIYLNIVSGVIVLGLSLYKLFVK